MQEVLLWKRWAQLCPLSSTGEVSPQFHVLVCQGRELVASPLPQSQLGWLHILGIPGQIVVSSKVVEEVGRPRVNFLY